MVAKRGTKKKVTQVKKAAKKKAKQKAVPRTRKKATAKPAAAKAASAQTGTSPRRRVPALSPREKEVIRLVSLGCSVKEAAAILGISPSTVDNHKYSAMHKLGTNKLALVTRLAIKKRITKLNDRLTPEEKERSGRDNDGWN
ncbi:MAG: LuxR family transcriptional regulator [Planctomycetota bacterium]|nr:MAG: LuxR family transcriptional regulator [Planctomycetota bacterium]